MKKVVLAAAIAAISSGALAQTSIPVNVSGLVVPAVDGAPGQEEEEKNCTVGSEGESVDLPFNDVEKGSAATSESDFISVSDCSGATVSLSTTEGDTQTSTIDGQIGSTKTAIALAANVAGSGGNLFEQSAEVDSDSTEIEVTASLTAEQTSEEGAVFAAGMIYVTIDGQDTPAPAPEERANAVLGEFAGLQGPAADLAKELETATMPVLGDLEGADPEQVASEVEGGAMDAVGQLKAAGTQLEEASEPVQSGISGASAAIQSAAAALEGAPQAIQDGVEGFQGQAQELAKELETATMPVLGGLEGANPQAFIEQAIGDAAPTIPTPPPSNGEEPSDQFEAALNGVASDGVSLADQAEATLQAGSDDLQAGAAELQTLGADLEEDGEANFEQVTTMLQENGNNVMQQGEEKQGDAESSIADFLTVEVSDEFNAAEVELEINSQDLLADVSTQR